MSSFALIYRVFCPISAILTSYSDGTGGGETKGQEGLFFYGVYGVCNRALRLFMDDQALPLRAQRGGPFQLVEVSRVELVEEEDDSEDKNYFHGRVSLDCHPCVYDHILLE